MEARQRVARQQRVAHQLVADRQRTLQLPRDQEGKINALTDLSLGYSAVVVVGRGFHGVVLVKSSTCIWTAVSSAVMSAPFGVVVVNLFLVFLYSFANVVNIDDCGILGCGGKCNKEGGCKPCPDEVGCSLTTCCSHNNALLDMQRSQVHQT
jgi:hypothetical protein